MLLDQSSSQLLRTNFLGRDGLVWWIGQVALPKTSKWDQSDLTAKKENVELYYNRVKVRILGYHTSNCQDLPDEKLPWAHILIPPGQANGTVKRGISHEYKGGETVIGFFLDGDDGQQPVIFGSLYKSSFIKPETSQQQILTKLCSEFKAFDSDTPLPHNSLGNTSPGGKNVGTGVGDENKPGTASATNKSGIDDISAVSKETIPASHKILSEKLDDKHQTVSICENNSINKILLAVERLLKKMRTIYAYAGRYYNIVRNKLANLTNEIRATASLITAFITAILKKGMNKLFDKLSKLVVNLIADLFPKPKQPKVGKLIDELFAEIYCLFKKFISSLFDWVLKGLFDFIGKAITAASCAVENFVGQLLNQVLTSIDEALGPILSQIDSIVGGALGSVGKILSDAMGIYGIIKGLLSCSDSSKACRPPQVYSMAEGVEVKGADNFERALNTFGVGGASRLLKDLEGELGLGELDLEYNSCNSSSTRCGPPRVEILGGGGIGAAANAIVNNFGRVIGVNMTSFGFGYEEVPVVSFIDDCNTGQYARGTAIVENQQVVNIIIDDPGEDYLNNTVTVNYGEENLDTQTSGSNSQDGKTYVSELERIVVNNPGYGYPENTTISANGYTFTPVFGANNGIVDVIVDKPIYFNDLPEIEINTDIGGGVGAVLVPVLKFTEITSGNDPKLAAIDPTLIIKVVDCVQK